MFALLILGPIIFYQFFNRRQMSSVLPVAGINQQKGVSAKPKIVLVFDDLGESLKELKRIYSLATPVTLAVIPGLRFSKNIAYIGSRCGFSILIHLPLEPKQGKNYRTNKYRFISSDLTKREINTLLKYYLNSIRIAHGVNMGSQTTEEEKLMRHVLEAVKRKGLWFIDSATSPNSVAYKIAKEKNMVCAQNDGFLDSGQGVAAIEEKLVFLLEKAKEKGKIIVIAHPRDDTLTTLEKKLPVLKKEVEFITLKEYFE